MRFDCRRACLGAYKRFDLTLENIHEERLDKSKFISLKVKPLMKSDFYRSKTSHIQLGNTQKSQCYWCKWRKHIYIAAEEESLPSENDTVVSVNIKKFGDEQLTIPPQESIYLDQNQWRCIRRNLTGYNVYVRGRFMKIASVKLLNGKELICLVPWSVAIMVAFFI